jgi:hypothetical protein
MLAGRVPSTAVSDHGSALWIASDLRPQRCSGHRRVADVEARGCGAASPGGPATAYLAGPSDSGRAGECAGLLR